MTSLNAELIIGHVPSFADVGVMRRAPEPARAKLMSEALADMLRRKIGREPPNALLQTELRDLGGNSTYVVVCHYTEEDAVARTYAFLALSARDTDWDIRAKELLQIR